jgi:hypothetical protein
MMGKAFGSRFPECGQYLGAELTVQRPTVSDLSILKAHSPVCPYGITGLPSFVAVSGFIFRPVIFSAYA